MYFKGFQLNIYSYSPLAGWFYLLKILDSL